MLKFGDYRFGGLVFIGFRKGCPGGEYWISLLRFESKYPDWKDKRKRMDENVRLLAWEKMQAKRRKDQRELFVSAHPIIKRSKRVFASDEERRQANIDKCRSWYHQGESARNLAREARKSRASEKAKVASAAREARLARIAENKAKRESIAAMRKPLVRLTVEERKQRKRDDKRNYKHRRRAIIREQEAKATPKQIREAMVKANRKCHYCGKKSKLTIDHVIPIAGGGSHTLDNIVFACHTCNSEKRDLPANEFGNRFGLLLV